MKFYAIDDDSVPVPVPRRRTREEEDRAAILLQAMRLRQGESFYAAGPGCHVHRGRDGFWCFWLAATAVSQGRLCSNLAHLHQLLCGDLRAGHNIVLKTEKSTA